MKLLKRIFWQENILPTEGTLFVIKVFFNLPFPFSVPKRILANQSCKHTNVPLSWNFLCYTVQGYISSMHQQRLLLLPKSFLTARIVSIHAVLKTMKRFHWPTGREWQLWHSYKTFCWLQIITRGLLPSLHSFRHRVCDARDHHYDRLLTRKEWALWQKYHTSCWLHSLAGPRPDFPGRVALKLTASMWCKRPPLW